MTTCFQHLVQLHELCKFQTIEGSRSGTASKSELRRWFEQSIIRINMQIVKENDPLPFIWEFTLFPKSNKKCTTLVWDIDTFIEIDFKILGDIQNEPA